MIPLLAGDDEDFARLARKVLAKVLHKHPHKLVLVLCLERALDIEHLGIAGMIPFSGGVSGSQITLPEVPSSRLLRQSRWVADELPGLWKEKSCPPLFGDRDKDWNLRNFLRTALASGLFFFYSRALTTSKIAAITLHYSHRSGVRSWQAQFQRSKSWKISTTLGITKEEVSALLDRAP